MKSILSSMVEINNGTLLFRYNAEVVFGNIVGEQWINGAPPLIQGVAGITSDPSSSTKNNAPAPAKAAAFTSKGMVAGLAVAIVVAMAAVGAAVFVYRRRRKSRGFAGEDEKDLDFSENPIENAEATQKVWVLAE